MVYSFYKNLKKFDELNESVSVVEAGNVIRRGDDHIRYTNTKYCIKIS